jgi:tRNA pseudouridine55 synthase
MNGLLVIDKPAGPTSFDVVHQVRRALKVKKVGHTGTLDPAATGVLPLCLGEATKIAGHILESEKAYEAAIRLGVTTDTLDAEGKVLSERPVPALDAGMLEAALARFRGTFLQTPPMFSAVKVDGKRLYEHARAGEEVARAAREVTVHELTLRDLSANELRVFVRCSKGFFVRVLAQGLGEALGCGGHLRALRRTQTGPFTLEQAIPLERLLAKVEAEGPASVTPLLVPIEAALAELPAVTVSDAEAVKVVHGVPLETHAQVAGKLRVMSERGALLAIAEIDRGRLRYARVLAQG